MYVCTIYLSAIHAVPTILVENQDRFTQSAMAALQAGRCKIYIL